MAALLLKRTEVGEAGTDEGGDGRDGLAQLVAWGWSRLAVPVGKVRTRLEIQERLGIRDRKMKRGIVAVEKEGDLEARDVVLDDGEVLVLHGTADLHDAAPLETHKHADNDTQCVGRGRRT